MSAAVSVPVTVPPRTGQAGGLGTLAGGVPVLLHRNSTIMPVSAGRPKWMCAWVTSDVKPR
jgi:hypothetical protein